MYKETKVEIRKIDAQNLGPGKENQFFSTGRYVLESSPPLLLLALPINMASVLMNGITDSSESPNAE
ncbi:MAG: hypothetical protein LQ351_006451 [Letrouitia transgressa]|nr:MAG: hypothetical protein LQ351_006451 [Letrouitia transgressa]